MSFAMSEVNFLTLDLRKTCRTCLSQDVINRNVFLKENGIELAEIIRCMTKIELVENDGLPQNLCESCADKLLKIHEFKETCEKVDAKLKEYISTKKLHVYIYEDEHNKTVGNVAEKILVSIKGESEESSENILQTCMDFKMEYVQGQEDISDTMISGDVDDGNNDIEIIGEQLETLSNTEFDDLENRNDGSISEIKVEDFAEDVEKCCHICSKNFKTRFDLNRHLNTHKDGQYSSCILCDIKFSSRIELTRHNQRVHRKNHTYQCTQCDKYFSRHYNLVRHVAENHVKSEIDGKQDKAGYVIRLNEKGLDNEQRTEDPLHIEGQYSQENVTGRKQKIYPCPVCNKLYNSSTGLQRHSRTHTGERPYLCNYCGKRFLMSTDLISHVRLHTGDFRFSCEICGKAYSKRYYLQKHMETHAKLQKFTCDICSKVYGSVGTLHQHLLLHEKNGGDEQEKNAELIISNSNDEELVNRGMHKCLTCSRAYTTAFSLKKHMKSHEYNEELVCDICSKTFHSSRSLREHTKQHVERPKYACHVCPKAFHKLSDRNSHLVTHTEVRPFLCATCGMAFKKKLQLTIHIRVHTNDRPYKCTICPKAFRQSATLTDHVLTHTNDAIFQCELCNKVYTKKGSYKSHVRTHKEDYGKRNHVCRICGKGFPLGAILNRHMTIHAERNIECPECGKAFRSQIHLKLHMKSHTKDNITICPVCGKCISRRSKLTIHMRTHTGERPYVCNICGKGNTTSTMLKVHLQTHAKPQRSRTKK